MAGSSRKTGRTPQGIWRKLIQLSSFLACNPFLPNFADGRIYTGKWKEFCSPGLNCYSCPAAALSCPIGAMQAVGGSAGFSFSFYVAGLLAAIGLFFGRAVCAFLCPFGLLQELLHKIPSPKLHLPRFLRFTKYAVLLVFVLVLPVADTNYAGIGDPAFCKWICPSGTLGGGIPLLLARPGLRAALGPLFSVKAAILVAVLAASVLVSRFFCRCLCPLGAVYGMFNKVSVSHLAVDGAACTGCGKCAAVCPMDCEPARGRVTGGGASPAQNARPAECIRCMKCAAACPHRAIRLSFAPGRA